MPSSLAYSGGHFDETRFHRTVLLMWCHSPVRHTNGHRHCLYIHPPFGLNLSMKHTFIGDIHGRLDVVKLALDKAGMKIFVGDFVDSFTATTDDQAQCLRLVLDAIKIGEAQAIYGNHELSYLIPQHRCSGFNLRMNGIMQAYEAEIRTHFKPHILLAPNFLVTHAGLSRQIWVEKRLKLTGLNTRLLNEWVDFSSFVHRIGISRGGYDGVGGTFWCDFNEEFQPVPELTQVFGHSSYKGFDIRRVEDSYCIDCLDKQTKFLEMDL